MGFASLIFGLLSLIFAVISGIVFGLSLIFRDVGKRTASAKLGNASSLFFTVFFIILVFQFVQAFFC